MTDADSLSRVVAHLQPGQHVTATVSPVHRGTYQITGILKDAAGGGLLLGGWEMVRLANGEPPVYLRSIKLDSDPTEQEEAIPGPRAWRVDQPALLAGVPDHIYHGGLVRTPGPQVSQSGLKMLRPPSTPREFQHRLLNGLSPSRALDFGRAVHTIALGEGEKFAACPADRLGANGARNTKAAKEWEAEQRAAGITPLSQADYDGAHAAAEELLLHPEAGELITDPAYRAEVSAYHEVAPGLWMRSRFDLCADGALDDIKTAADPHPDAWRRQAWKLGYYVQDVAYRRAYATVTGRPDPGPMRFIVVGSSDPYLVAVYTLDADFERLGVEQLDAAVALYADQYAKHGDPRADGVRWDGLPSETATLSPPRPTFYDAEGVEYDPEF